MRIRRPKRIKKYNGDSSRRLWVILGLAGLIFLCLLGDAWNNGNIRIQKEAEVIPPTEVKKGADKKNSAGQSEQTADQQMIRVLIMTTGFSSLFHQEIEITGTDSFRVRKGKKETEYSKGDRLRISMADLSKGKEKIVISSQEGRLKVMNVSRQAGTPCYRGDLEITRKKQGLLLINELSLREYLYSVVPSEMTTSSPMEALKTQAVCARSFALRQIDSDNYKQYNANMDDSTNFQVYNNIFEDKRSRKAVNSTEGQVVKYEGQIISTYYFSTSWGYVASVEEVWNSEKIPYLSRRLQITEESKEETGLNRLDLSDIRIFRKFITEKMCDTYDRKSCWYRWQVKLTAEELSQRCNVGKVTKVQVTEREKSGLATEITIVGKEGKEKLIDSYDIRQRLKPGDSPIVRQDNSKVEQLGMLPSSAILIQDYAGEKETGFLIRGGGFGHGVGMSQTGAEGMAEAGIDYKEILQHYYPDCQIGKTG